MKKLLVLSFSVLMVLVFAVSASAASLVSLDTMLGGSLNTSGFMPSECDYSQNNLTFATNLDRFEFAMQYGIGKETNSGDAVADVTVLNLKAGYIIYQKLATKVDVSLMNGTLKSKYSDDSKSELDLTFLGVGLTQFFSEKIFVTANYGTLISGSAKSDFTDTDKSLPGLTYGISGNYLFNKNIGASLVYGMTKGDIDVVVGGTKLGKNTVELSGYTLSLFYIF